MTTLVEIARYHDAAEAQIARSVLLDSGIHCEIFDHHTANAIPLYTIATGIRLMVPPDDRDEATEILRDMGPSGESTTPYKMNAFLGLLGIGVASIPLRARPRRNREPDFVPFENEVPPPGSALGETFMTMLGTILIIPVTILDIMLGVLRWLRNLGRYDDDKRESGYDP